MDLEKIKSFCGIVPSNYEFKMVDENTIFEVDPNFSPINLYDFWGNAATVNSFFECANYINGGWRPNKTTLFDILQIVLIASSVLLLTAVIYKYKKRIGKKWNSISKKSKLSSVIFPIQVFLIYGYVKSKAVKIPSFIDEYITLTSNVGFYTSLNYDAGSEFGGNYSVQLTSGPISDLGGVIGWILTNSIYISRVSNFFWIYFLQFLFILLLRKVYFKNVEFLVFINGLFIILIPWWIGALYGIGEIASMVVFTNAIYLFSKKRELSITLFAISIIFGKYLTLLGFLGFYLARIFNERKIRLVGKDFSLFSIPILSWLGIVNFKYQNGNALSYINDQIDFILDHQSSGLNEENSSFIYSLLSSLQSSEFINWTDYDKIRILVAPLIFIILIIKNRKVIDDFFGYVALPIFYSVLLPFIWFWIINPTKWIRLSQHFTVIIIISIVYLINFEIVKSRFDLFMLILIFGVFIEETKYLILALVIFALGIILIYKNQIPYSKIKVLLILICVINITIPYFEQSTPIDFSLTIKECQIKLDSSECRYAYMENGK
tara:strand:- start:803 stop:2449 length:1647 start_codon:yes stop_codon:yes gene_type:complete